MQELSSAPPNAAIPPLPPPSIPTTSYSGFVPVSLPTNTFALKEDEASSVTSCNSGSIPEKLNPPDETIDPNN